MGVLVIQVYIYALSFPHDKLPMKALVYSTFLLDVFQSCLASHFAWHAFVSGWGNSQYVMNPPWTFKVIPPLTGLITLIVQYFFSWRIWVLAGGIKYYMWILALIIVSAFGSFISLVYATIVTKVWLSKDDPKVALAFTLWGALSIVCDVLITTTLVFQLYSRRSNAFGGVSHILHRAIRIAIETGAVTTVAVIVELIFIWGVSSTGWFYMMGLMLGKLYSNSLLATLNSRSATFQGSSTGVQSSAQVWDVRAESGENTLTNNIKAVPERAGNNQEVELNSMQTTRGATALLIAKNDYPAFPTWN